MFLTKKNLVIALKTLKAFHSKFYSTRLRRLISNILQKIAELFLPSAADILDFIVSFCTLSALNDFLQDYDFVMIIMGDFSATEKLSKNHFMLISLIFLRITRMKQFN